MATQEEAAGAGLAAQALAFAAIEMVIRLGHADTIDEIKKMALETLDAAIFEGSNLNRDKVLDHGRMIMLALTETAKVKATLQTGSPQ